METNKPLSEGMSSGRRIILLQALLLVFAIILLLGLTRPRTGGGTPERDDRLLIAAFVDSTDDPALAPGLKQILALALEQSPRLRLLSESRMRHVLRGMHLNPRDGTTPAAAAAVCAQEGIRLLLVPSLGRLGDSYLVSARLVQVHDGILREIPVDTARVTSKTELICAMDEMARKVRKTIGESDQALEMTGPVLPPSATANAEALSLFIHALALGAKENYDGELSILKQTVRLNPRFALAQLTLGELCLRLGRKEAAREPLMRAAQDRESLPLKERLHALGIYLALNEEYARAREQYRDLAIKYPGDPGAEGCQADIAIPLLDFAGAAEHYEKAIGLDDSRVESYLGLCMARLLNNEGDAARKAWERAAALEPGNPRVIYTGGFIDLVINDLGSALRAFRQVSESPYATTRSLGMFLVAQAQIYGGRFQLALATLVEGIDSDRNLGNQDSVVSKCLTRAEVYLLLGDDAKALEECRRISPMSIRAEDIGRMGAIYARAGQVVEAQNLLSQIEKLPRSWKTPHRAAVLRGEIELAAGRIQAAISLLMQAKDLLPGGPPLEPLARALARAQRYDQAEQEYRSICQQKAEMLFPPTDSWFMGTWANSLFETALCLDNLGRSSEAIQFYRSYLWVLDGADPRLPRIQQAKEQLKKGSSRTRMPNQ